MRYRNNVGSYRLLNHFGGSKMIRDGISKKRKISIKDLAFERFEYKLFFC